MKNRIRVLRAERAWSQAELAERVRVSRNSINAIENGKFDLSLPLAFRLRTIGARTDCRLADTAARSRGPAARHPLAVRRRLQRP